MDDDLELSTIDKKYDIIKPTVSKLSGLIKEIGDEINLVRTKPEKYLTKIKNFRKGISEKDNSINVNGETLIFEDIENQFEDLVKFLEKLTPLQPLFENELLINSSEELIETIKKYESKDDTIISNYIIDLSNRLKKYGIINGAIGEIIDVGWIDSAEVIVLKLLLDENQDKSERNLILNENIRYYGGSNYDFNLLESMITSLNFSQNHSVKKENSTINLNMKFATERLGKKQDSSKCYIYKHNKSDKDKKTVSKKFKTDRTSNATPVSKISGPRKTMKEFMKTEMTEKNIKLAQISPSENHETTNTNLKNLRITNDTMNRASILMKKLPDRINYNNTKIVNINLNIENKRKLCGEDVEDNPIEHTKMVISSTKNDLKKKFEDIINTEDSQSKSGYADYMKYNLKSSTIDSNTNSSKKTMNIDKKNRKSNAMIDDSRKVKQNKSDNQRPSSNNKPRNNKHIVSVVDKKQFDREIIENQDIKCMKINKTVSVDEGGKEYYIIKKTIYYNDNSLDEWIYKEEI